MVINDFEKMVYMKKLVELVNEIINNGFKNVDFYSLQLDYQIMIC